MKPPAVTLIGRRHEVDWSRWCRQQKISQTGPSSCNMEGGKQLITAFSSTVDWQQRYKLLQVRFICGALPISLTNDHQDLELALDDPDGS